MDKTIVNIGPKEFASGITYVACSRVRRLADLVFDPYPNYLRFCQIFATKSFQNRLYEKNKEHEADLKKYN